MTTIASTLQAVRDAIAVAAIEAGRHRDEVTLLAVSKTFPHHALREAYQAGQARFAESYVQEALGKIAALHGLAIEWHCIGPNLPNLKLRGRRAFPAPGDDVAAQRLPFAQLRQLRDRLNQQGLQLDTLSMGMSHDFPAAIAEGATMGRIGTAIFGE